MKISSITSSWFAALAVAWGAVLGGCATTPVFRDGQVLLPVFVAADASPEERAAAEELGSVLGKMSGLAWPVRPAARLDERGFYVGRSGAPAGRGPALKLAADLLAPGKGEMEPDAFRIWSRDGSVVIEGATPEATGFAVAWLLQRQGGVRWYAPGATGEVIPRRTKWSLPKLRIVREPAYVSREITGLQTPDEMAWARRNGLRGRLEFSHALDRVFSPKDFAGHPDWLPQLGNERYTLASAADHNWQPNLVLPEVAEHAARAAVAAFQHDPGRASFSLGINDNMRFDESPATRKLVEPLRYFRGQPDYSPLVFAFMNRAAQSLAGTVPNRYLGGLAYFWSENPPPFPMNARVLPFVTTDRSQYYDRQYRAADLALMSRWGASGVQAFGLWEYGYGQGFLVPRQPLAALAEAVREGRRRGAQGYIAEILPHWGFDTFKVWMLAQLLWEPNVSHAKLADDFYRGYFGAAAGPMRRFFERCEAQWMAQPGPPYWLKFYQQEDQALLFPPITCRDLRALLDEADALAATDPVIASRVALTSRAFAVTEAFVEFDAIRRGLALAGSAKDENLAPLLRAWLEAESRVRDKLGVAVESDRPALAPGELANYLRNDPVPRLLWLAGQGNPVAPRRVLESVGIAALSRETWRALSVVFSTGSLPTAPNLVVNGGFVETAAKAQEPRFLFPGFGDLPADWEVRAMPTELGKVTLGSIDAVTRRRTLRIEGAWDTQVYQWRPAEAGSRYVATAQLRGQSSPGNDSALCLTFLTADGKSAGSYRMQSLPKGPTSEWRTTVLADRAPPGAAWVGVGVGVARQVAGDWIEVDKVELRGVAGTATP